MSEARTVWIGDPLALVARRPPQVRLVAPPRVATAAGVPAVSLTVLARARLEASGWRVASRLQAWRALGSAVEEVVEGPDGAAWRRALAAPVRELLAAGVGAPSVAAGGDESGPPEDWSMASMRAWRVAARVAGRLAGENRIDPAAVLAVAARLPAGSDPSDVPDAPWFVLAPLGLAADACAFAATAAPAGSIVVVPPEAGDTRERLQALGFRLAAGPSERDGRERASPQQGVRRCAYAFATADDEARWVLADVRRSLAAGVAASEMAVVVADPASEAARFEAIAYEFGIPLRVRRSLPLAATTVGGFLTGAFDAVQRDLPYEATLRTLRHRLAGGMPGESLDQVRTRRPAGPDAWRALDPRADALVWPERAPRSTFLVALRAWLEQVGLPRDDLPSHESAALQLVLRGLEPEDAGDAPLTRSAFLTDARDLLELLTVAAPAVRPRDADPEAGDARPVELLAPGDAAQGRVGTLYLTGLVEGVTPPDLRDAAVLDFRDRQIAAAAGLPLVGAAERSRSAWCAVAAATRAARDRVVATLPRRTGGGATLPSPYLARLGLDPVAAPPRAAASLEERRRSWLLARAAVDPAAIPPPPDDDPVAVDAAHAWRVELRRESAAPPDRHDGVTGCALDLDRTRFSATRLQAIGQCGFRFFARYRLGLSEPEEADERISPLLRGRLWHGALERAVGRALATAGDGRDGGDLDDDRGHERLRAAIVARLPAAYADAERREAVPDPDGEAWRRVRAGELLALERFVASDAFLRPGLRPRIVEHPFDGSFRGLAVTGVVDRVDGGDGALELVDYKTGTARPKGALADDRRRWIDVQLPLYLETAAPALARAAGVPAGSVRARYLSVRSGETLLEVEPGAHDADLDEVVARVRRLAGAGAWLVDPDARREACRTCELAPVCRVGPRIERKRDAVADPPGTS